MAASTYWCVVDRTTGEILRECAFKEHAESEARRFPQGCAVQLPHYNLRRYSWDRWQARALVAGVDEELIQLGRNVMRLADTYGSLWPEAKKTACGLNDEGAAMLDLALHHPLRAKTLWQELLMDNGVDA